MIIGIQIILKISPNWAGFAAIALISTFQLRFWWLSFGVATDPFSILFVFLYQAIFLVCCLVTWRHGFSVLLNTIVLLLFANLFTNGLPEQFSKNTTYKTLPPFLFEKVKIVGEVMPGFNGVNTITTDSKGFRTSGKVNYQSAETYRLFAIGGSTTEEIFTSDNETWTKLLENHLNQQGDEVDYEIINTGVSGLRAEHHLSTIKNTEQFNPDYYPVLVGANDWIRHIELFFEQDELDAEEPIIFQNLQQTMLYVLALQKYQYFKGLKDTAADGRKADIKIDAGEYYSKQNNSLNRPDVRKLRIAEVDPAYRRFMEQISERCSAGLFDCMFISQPNAYSKSVTDFLKQRFLKMD